MNDRHNQINVSVTEVFETYRGYFRPCKQFNIRSQTFKVIRALNTHDTYAHSYKSQQE